MTGCRVTEKVNEVAYVKIQHFQNIRPLNVTVQTMKVSQNSVISSVTSK